MRKEETAIAILMATYNGERFIEEQIDSLLLQTNSQWHLYIHDDGSSDRTLEKIRNYITIHPDKITLLDYPAAGGACMNFISLMNNVNAPYYMFCDQDDVWKPTKIEKSICEMEKQEINNPDKAIIVCSDLAVTDENLNVIHPRRSQYSALYPAYIRTFDDCAPTAAVTGCTMLFNQKAKECMEYPVKEIAMHDRWLCLSVLKHNGMLCWIDEPLMYYRQHGANCLGAGSIDATSIGFLYRITHIKKILQRHIEHYGVLRALGYGSPLKYIKHVLLYRKRIKRRHY